MKVTSLTVLILMSALLCAAQAPAVPAEKTPARIEGKTVNAIDNTPLRNVEIVLMGNESEAFPHAAKSDAEGRFSFPKVAPGTYYVSISRTGFVTRRTTRALLTNGGTITLSEGEKMVDVTIPLWPAAVIRGKVLDANGEPVANANVAVLRPDSRRKSPLRAYALPQNANTDDNGDYRLFGIVPGRYLVLATGLGGMSGTMASFADSDVVKENRTVPTYYPGTADYSQATPITLRAGEELPLNIMLTTARTVHVRGSVSSKVPPTTFVLLMSLNEYTFGGRAQVKDGKFDIPGVSPGRYMLQAVSVNEGDMEPKMARQMVVVGPTGADNIVVTLGGRSQVTGSIKAEGGKLDFKKLRLMLLPADMDEDGAGFSFGGGDRDNGRVHDDGSVTFKELNPGRYRVVVSSYSPGLEDWYTKSVHVGTQEVTDTGFDVAPDATLAMQVVLSANGGTIEGVAVDDKEKPWPNVVVVAVPESKRRYNPDFYGNASADQHGRFKMRGLAPGEYTVLAFEDRELAEEVHDPETLKALETSGLKVKVEEKSHKNTQPKVIPISDDP